MCESNSRSWKLVLSAPTGPLTQSGNCTTCRYLRKLSGKENNPYILQYDVLTFNTTEETILVNVFSAPKKKDSPTEQEKQPAAQNNPPQQPSEEPMTTIQKLRAEESQLAEEKQNLLQRKEQLQKKIKSQIDSSKNNVDKLKAEVEKLKFECAQLDESLQEEMLTT